jgi:hypothetical protein
MKKCIAISLITIITLLVSGTLCLAQLDRTVTNTSKKGSLLIWPLVKVTGGGDTIIQLTNNYYAPVKVKCFYRVSNPCDHTSWIFTLLPNQTIAWLASTGKGPDGQVIPAAKGRPPALAPGTVAELRCWAVDSSGAQQIAWNWLSGDAIVKEGTGKQSWEYSAWRFAVNSSTTGANAGTAGSLLLTGDSGNYDACPTALIFNFFKQTGDTTGAFPAGTVNAQLTLVPCKQDLVTNANPVVYASMVPQDEVQSTLSSAFACVGCANPSTQWYSESLASGKLGIIGSTTNPFLNIGSPGGSVFVHGKQQSGSCPGSTGVPLLGVMSMQFSSSTGPVAGATPTGVGPGQAYVKDADDEYTSDPILINWN